MLSRRVGKRAGGKVRAALTPSPAPALRERGDLGGGIGIVDRCRRSIAPAPLLSPFRSRSVGEEGGWGEVRAALTPGPAPALRERGDLGGGIGTVDRCPRSIAPAPLLSPFRSRSVGVERGLEGR